MFNVYETNACGTYEAIFKHPDVGVEIHFLCIEDMSLDCDENYDEQLRDKIWKMFDPSYYYHELTLKSKYILDDYLYVVTTNFTRYTVDTQPTKRYKLVEAPFQK